MKNKYEHGILTFVGFILVVLCLILGGHYLINRPQEESKDEFVAETYKKKDEEKDFIYYTNIDELSEEGNLNYKDININLDSMDATNVENKLNKDMQAIRNLYQKITPELENEEIEYNYDDVYEATLIDYNIYDSSDYLTIEVIKYQFSAIVGETIDSINYYVFNKYDGLLKNNQDLMKSHSINGDNIRSAIYNALKDIDNVDIDATMNNDYQLSINEEGKVVINIVVKNGDINYNESIVMNEEN